MYGNNFEFSEPSGCVPIVLHGRRSSDIEFSWRFAYAVLQKKSKKHKSSENENSGESKSKKVSVCFMSHVGFSSAN